MRTVLLTVRGSRFGAHLAAALDAHGVTFTIVETRQPLFYHARLFTSIRRRTGLVDALYFSTRRVMDGLVERTSPPADMATIPRHSTAGGPGSADTCEVLRSLAPDLLVLGQTGVVGPSVLDIPAIGTLNAHPGLLPAYRGIDCGRWAVVRGELDQIGASVHWVDRGVDTGPIVCAEWLDVRGMRTLDDLDRALNAFAIELLAASVASMDANGVQRGRPQRPSDGRQYYKMPRATERIAQESLRKLHPTSSAHPADLRCEG